MSEFSTRIITFSELVWNFAISRINFAFNALFVNLHLDNKRYFANYRHTLELFFLQHAGTTMKRLTVALIAALSSPIVLAVEKPYLGIDYQMGTLSFNNNIEAEPELVRLRAGTEINPYLAVEAHIGASAKSDTITVNGVNYDAKVNSLYGAFLRPQLRIADVITGYALLGGCYLDKTVESQSAIITAAQTSGFESSFAAGAGLEVKLHKNIGLNVDYMKYSSDYKAVSAGLKVSF